MKTNKVRNKILPVVFLATGFILSVMFFAVMRVESKPLPANGKILSVIAMGKTYEFSYPEIDFYDGEYYLKSISETVDGIFKDTVNRPVDAYYTTNCSAENPFTYYREHSGIGIDKKKLEKSIRCALNSGETVVEAETVELTPSVTIEDLKARLVKLSEFSTSYCNSTASRKKNIKLAAAFIGCKEIRSGFEFSFNDIVGERSEARGFSSAVVIENGKFVEGIGGGVCQVSSTVYACAASAGMKIKERKRHTLLVSYTSPSFDAMVSSRSSDLRFENQSGNTVTIVADADENRIRVRIYGCKSDMEYKLVSCLTEYIEPPETQIIETDTLKAGEYSPMIIPKRGARSKAYLETYKDGNLISRKLLSDDTYSPLAGITLKGRAEP